MDDSYGVDSKTCQRFHISAAQGWPVYKRIVVSLQDNTLCQNCDELPFFHEKADDKINIALLV